jgi:hypothetical protein
MTTTSEKAFEKFLLENDLKFEKIQYQRKPLPGLTTKYGPMNWNWFSK